LRLCKLLTFKLREGSLFEVRLRRRVLTRVIFFQDAAEWASQVHHVHQRTSDRILSGCLRNGGLYIKLGQGLVSFNHILPEEYLDTLQVLYDKAPARRKNEVTILSILCVNYQQLLLYSILPSFGEFYYFLQLSLTGFRQ